MSTLTSTTLRLGLVAVVGAGLVAGLGTTHAVADDTDVTLTGGSLAITAVPAVGDFQAVTLDGTAQTTTASFDGFEVNDARGTGAGWDVTIQATQFAEHDAGAYVPGGRTLALNSLSMAAPTVAADGTTSAVPTLVGGPYAIDAGTAVTIGSAAADTGMGRYDFAQDVVPLTLSIPETAYATTYRSTVTVSVVSGP